MLRFFSRPAGRFSLPTPALLRVELLAGLVVGLALIPEAISFSVIAGVDPKVGLFASCVIAMTIAVVGGRPAMISAATGAMALVIVPLVKDHGAQYLLAAAILAGLLQVLAGVFKLGSLMRFVSRSVITGFVNALAILIFLAQMPELIGRGPTVYVLCAAALAIILGIFAAVATPAWFDRDGDGFTDPALSADILGLICALLVALQVVLAVVAMIAFRQRWNIEEERAPHPEPAPA